MAILFIILFMFLAFGLWKLFKIPKTGNMLLITGGVKTGKTTLAVHMAIRLHKKQVFKTRFKNFFRKIFRKPLAPLPLLYSNITLKYPHVLVSKSLLERKERFVYGSVIYLSEYSLIADSQMFQDKILNERLLLFHKLIGHETRGGYLVAETQCIGDCHYGLKRCLSNYLYVHHTLKWIPFFLFMYVRELKYSDDNSSMNVFEEDVEETLKLIIVPKRVWKIVDCYTFSALTDSLPVQSSLNSKTDLKTRQVISFKNYHTIEVKKNDEEKKNTSDS